MLSAREQLQPINLWRPSRIRVSILVDMWKYRSLVPVVMTSFMDLICKSQWMVWDLLPRHNALWVSLLKMLISQTLSLYGACFFFPFFFFLIIWVERKKRGTLAHVLSCALCTLSYGKKKYYLGPVMRFTTDLIYSILVCLINILCYRKTKTSGVKIQLMHVSPTKKGWYKGNILDQNMESFHWLLSSVHGKPS